MTGVLRRRSVRAITRGGSRAWLMIATLATTIVGVWLLAIPGVIDTTMNRRIEAHALYDIRAFPNALPLDSSDLALLRDLPSITASEARIVARGAVGFEGRTVDVSLIGVDDFGAGSVDRVIVATGAAPSTGQVLVDGENLRHGRLKADTSDTLVLYGPDSTPIRVSVSGTGGSLLWSADVREGDPVVYMRNDDLAALTGWPGATSIEFRVDRSIDVPTEATLEAIESTIEDIAPGMTYWRAVTVRPEGDWPDKDGFDKFRSMFTILAAVAVLSGLFVVYNTVNSMVRREVMEIGTLKALGGRRRDVARSYLTTALLMGAIATVVGSILGVLLSNLLVGSIGSSLLATRPDFVIPVPILALAVLVGLGGTMLAALPGILWATRIPVREALESHGIEASIGRTRFDRTMSRVRFLSRPVQLGLRSATRDIRRTTTTGIQVGIAVAMSLAFISLGATMLELVDQSFDAEHGDIHVYDQGGARPLDAEAAADLASVDGVASIDPVHYAGLDFEGTSYGAWALPPDTQYAYDLQEGRWFERGETGVVVVGQALAAERDLDVGDVIGVDRWDGPLDVEVIGIDRVMVDDGKAFFVPLQPWLDAAGRTAPNAFWVSTVASDPNTVDTVAGRIEQALAGQGYATRTELRYVERAASRSEAALILSFIVLLGVPVLAIGMIALVNTLTINAIERTKEIGVLKSIGARRRHLARMYRAEGMAIAGLGWLVGIPLGWAIAHVLVWAIANAFEATFPVVFPWWSPFPVLVLTLAISAVAVRRPLRRAVRMSAGDALRYE